MIPKKIHYCWFGHGTFDDLQIKCIESWKKYCPDYEIIEWNEDNFNLDKCLYAKQAYENKKYAFVTDYARLYILYKYGGIYVDTDVEILKNLDCFLNEKGFSGFESSGEVPTGIMASEAGLPIIGELLDKYKNRSFIVDGKMNLTTNVKDITLTFKDKGLKTDNSKQTIEGFTMYPNDYFCPKDWITESINLTDNSYTIHHFNGSWMSGTLRFKLYVAKLLSPVLEKLKNRKER